VGYNGSVEGAWSDLQTEPNYAETVGWHTQLEGCSCLLWVLEGSMP